MAVVIFTKTLSQTDVKQKLSVPSKKLRHFPSFNGGQEIEFEAIDKVSGTPWSFCCKTRRNGHPKPVIYKGWSSFVRKKGLKKGDLVTFSKDADATTGGTCYKVYASRRIFKLLGSDIFKEL